MQVLYVHIFPDLHQDKYMGLRRAISKQAKSCCAKGKGNSYKSRVIIISVDFSIPHNPVWCINVQSTRNSNALIVESVKTGVGYYPSV